jgi:hypothetical protein
MFCANGQDGLLWSLVWYGATGSLRISLLKTLLVLATASRDFEMAGDGDGN